MTVRGSGAVVRAEAAVTETGTGAPGGPAGAAAGQDVPGLDLAAFGAYFTAAYPGTVRGPLRASVLAGGKSNLTYEVTDAVTGRWVVRRPPLGHVLATAHDMAREYQVISRACGHRRSRPADLRAVHRLRGARRALYLMEGSTGRAPEGRGTSRSRPPPGPGHLRAADRHARGVARGGPAAVGLATRPAGRMPRPAGAPLEEAARRVARPGPAGIDELHAALAGRTPRGRRGHRARRLPAGQRARRRRRPDRGGDGLGDGHARRPADRRGAATRLPDDGSARYGFATPMRPRARLPRRRGSHNPVPAPAGGTWPTSASTWPRVVQARGDPRGHRLPGTHGQTVGEGFEVGAPRSP